MKIGDIIPVWIYQADAPFWIVHKDKAFGRIAAEGRIEVYGWNMEPNLEEPTVLHGVTDSPNFEDWTFYMASTDPNDEARFCREMICRLAKRLYKAKERKEKKE